MGNLLLVESEYPKHISVGQGAIYALLGFCVVFLGIAILVGVLTIVGKIMKTITNKKSVQKTDSKTQSVSVSEKSVLSDELTEETIVAITAAIMAFYEQENRKCEFTVKRIKRI